MLIVDLTIGIRVVVRITVTRRNCETESESRALTRLKES